MNPAKEGKWIDAIIKRLKLDQPEHKILEIGSRDVTGTARDYWPKAQYTGLDLALGPNVGVRGLSSKLPFKNSTFDVVVCLSVFEHDPLPWVTIQEIHRVLMYDGHLLCCAPDFGSGRHDWPDDYYRFSSSGMRALLTWGKLEILGIETVQDRAKIDFASSIFNSMLDELMWVITQMTCAWARKRTI